MDADTHLRLEGKWDQLKGKVKETWGEITDDDLDRAEGNLQQLVGRIKEKTGQTADEIERKLEELDR